MKKHILLLAVAVVGCGVGQQSHLASTGSCYLDPKTNTTFVCWNADGSPNISPGYTAKQVIALMHDREENAWGQLFEATDRRIQANFDSVRASKFREEYGKSPRLHDIRSVTVSKAPGGQYVLSLEIAGSARYTLWTTGTDIDSALKVRSVTSY